ncbi:hypothetical protein CFOL_v3_36128, partial [Cephalotus follicularis]
DVLHNFADMSGLQPNLEKCQIFFGNVDSSTRRRAINMLQIPEGSLPIRYLGLPLLSSKLSKMDCKVLLDKLVKRTSSWVTNSLSFGGRLQLIASVLFSIQVFWCSTFILPVAVTKECDRIMRRFLWHGAGSGWEICNKKASIWTEWCFAVFLKENNFWAAKVTNNCSWSWRNILKIRKLLVNKLHYEVGDG